MLCDFGIFQSFILHKEGSFLMEVGTQWEVETRHMANARAPPGALTRNGSGAKKIKFETLQSGPELLAGNIISLFMTGE